MKSLLGLLAILCTPAWASLGDQVPSASNIYSLEEVQSLINAGELALVFPGPDSTLETVPPMKASEKLSLVFPGPIDGPLETVPPVKTGGTKLMAQDAYGNLYRLQCAQTLCTVTPKSPRPPVVY